jgi:outer membrane protein OmpA-like peptidoglycan-associated protein
MSLRTGKKELAMHFRDLCTIAAILVLVGSTPGFAQKAADPGDMIESLHAVTNAPSGISAASLRRLAQESIRNRPGPAQNREPLAEQLYKLPQFTLEINFDYNSAIIRPDSYRAIGRIADALHHPTLLGYKFIVAGNTDASGSREYNLKLSQQRADAVVEALTTTFRVPVNQVDAVGLGEEQLRDSAHPEAAVNRRVQLLNIGR